MSDGLPHLLPDDPQNLLSIEARKRIQRALIQSETFFWKAEVMIEKLKLPTNSRKAQLLRNEANFKKAKAALSAYRREFSQLDISEKSYRKVMSDEIEAASNSLELSGIQLQLLEAEFFFPEEKASSPSPLKPFPLVSKVDTVGEQINRLRDECRMTTEELAEEIGVETRSVQRHIAGKSTPYDRHLRAYERVFSKLLNRQVVIRKMS